MQTGQVKNLPVDLIPESYYSSIEHPSNGFPRNKAQLKHRPIGAELVATQLAIDMIDALRYKLRMFGIPIGGPTTIWCDNQSVVHNSTTPDSALQKKHDSISYHHIQEAVAVGYIIIRKIGTHDNLADILTKPLSAPKVSTETIPKLGLEDVGLYLYNLKKYKHPTDRPNNNPTVVGHIS